MNIDLLLRHTPSLPSIPEVVQELIQTLDQADVSASEIARTLATDQVLSAKVLRLANSAYYSVPRTIATVDEAIKMLGINTVRTIVLSAAMPSSFQPIAGVDLKPFWRYSLHTAVAARHLAAIVGADADLAFTVGLLHSIGRLVMMGGMPDDMERIDSEVPPYPCKERVVAEREAFGFCYADVGSELVRRWNFPDGFCTAIAGAALPLETEPQVALHAILHLASWRAKSDELKTDFEGLMATWPKAICDLAGLSREELIDNMPPLAELSAGLEDIIGA